MAKPEGQILQAVPQGQPVAAVAVQLAGQLSGGHSWDNAAQDQEDRAGAVGEALQGGAGKGVEDPPAGAAPIIDDRLTAAAMNAEAIGPATVGTGHSLRVKPGDQLMVAGIFIQQVKDGEIHGVVSPVPVPMSRSCTISMGNGRSLDCQ
jgi:hypothetical protein